MCRRPGGVDEHEVGVAARRRGHRVEHDRTGIGAVLAAHELAAGALGPQPELIGGRGAERVGRGEHHAPALAHLLRRELADRRGLADAVDAHEHPDVRLAGDDAQLAARARVEDRDHFVAHQRDEPVGVDDVVGLGPGAHRVEDALRRGEADVGEQHRLFEIVPGVVVDLAAAQAGEHARRTRRACGRADRAAAASRERTRRAASSSAVEVSGVELGNVELRCELDFEIGDRLVDRRRGVGRVGAGVGRGAARRARPASSPGATVRDRNGAATNSAEPAEHEQRSGPQ